VPQPVTAETKVDVLQNLSGTDYLSLIYALLNHVYAPGQMKGTTDYLTLANANVFQKLYNNKQPSPHPIYAAIVQNLSTDPLTLALVPDPSKSPSPPLQLGQSIVLNPASTSGQAGGSHTYINIDLDTVWIIGATATDAFTVEWFV
jgi:hypothetical protein